MLAGLFSFGHSKWPRVLFPAKHSSVSALSPSVKMTNWAQTSYWAAVEEQVPTKKSSTFSASPAMTRGRGVSSPLLFLPPSVETGAAQLGQRVSVARRALLLLQFTGWAWHPSQFQIHWEYRLGRGTKYLEKGGVWSARLENVLDWATRKGVRAYVFSSVCTAQLMGSTWACSNLITFDHVLISYFILKPITSGLIFSSGGWFKIVL